MTKLRLLLGLIVCVGVAGLVGYLFLFRDGGINRATVLRIREGMSEHEVERVIGMPPGDYSERTGGIIGLGLEAEEHVRFWRNDSGKIAVWFNADGTVNERSYTPASETWLDRLAEWLGMN